MSHLRHSMLFFLSNLLLYLQVGGMLVLYLGHYLKRIDPDNGTTLFEKLHKMKI